MWTCIECEFPFDSLTGNVEERTCHDCLNDDSDAETKTTEKENE